MKYTNYVREVALNGLVEQETLDHFDGRKLCVHEFKDGIVVPSGEHGGGLYNSRRIVEWSNFNGRIEPAYSDGYVNSDEEVLYIGMIFGIWGHCLTDFLRHVWPLLGRKYKIVYTTVLPSDRIPDNYFAMLRALGVEDQNIVRIVKPTRFKKVYFGDPSYFLDENRHGRFFTKEYADTIDAIRAHCLKEVYSGERGGAIYLSRAGWKKGRVDFGENLVERAFIEHYNCRVVHPEKLSLGELVRELDGCDTLVATEGSIAHNSIFLRKGCNLISIRKTDYINRYQPMISQVRDLNVTYIDANYTYIYPVGSEPWFGPFLLGVNDRLARFLNCRRSSCLELFIPFLKFTSRYAYMRARRMASICKAFFRRKIFHR